MCRRRSYQSGVDTPRLQALEDFPDVADIDPFELVVFHQVIKEKIEKAKNPTHDVTGHGLWSVVFERRFGQRDDAVGVVEVAGSPLEFRFLGVAVPGSTRPWHHPLGALRDHLIQVFTWQIEQNETVGSAEFLVQIINQIIGQALSRSGDEGRRTLVVVQADRVFADK